MISFSAHEYSMLALAFGYQNHSAALLAMESLGDEKASSVFSRLREEWESGGKVPDLSHQAPFGKVALRPSQDELIQSLSGLIDSYDRAREAGQRYPLRKTVEALFELRATARISSSRDPVHTSTLWERELGTFPLSSLQVKKLAVGGFRQLADLQEVPAEVIAAKSGFSEKQVSNLLNTIHSYVLETIDFDQLKSRKRLMEIGTEALGEEFKLAGTCWNTFLVLYALVNEPFSWETPIILAQGDDFCFQLEFQKFVRHLRYISKSRTPDEQNYERYTQLAVLIKIPQWPINVYKEQKSLGSLFE